MTEQRFLNGAFLSLKGQELVLPQDLQDYSQLQSDIFSKQAVVLLFGMFWARMYELGRFKYMIPNRLMYYGIVVGAPSLLHAFWVSSKLNDFSDQLDHKYQDQYHQYLDEKRTKSAIKNGQRI